MSFTLNDLKKDIKNKQTKQKLVKKVKAFWINAAFYFRTVGIEKERYKTQRATG